MKCKQCLRDEADYVVVEIGSNTKAEENWATPVCTDCREEKENELKNENERFITAYIDD